MKRDRDGRPRRMKEGRRMILLLLQVRLGFEYLLLLLLLLLSRWWWRTNRSPLHRESWTSPSPSCPFALLLHLKRHPPNPAPPTHPIVSSLTVS